MEVDEEKSRIRRSPSVPLPEDEAAAKEQAKMTVYVKGFEKEKMTLDYLLDFFNMFDNVVNVFKRTWQDKKSKERFFKGSVFVTFKDRESAEKFMAVERGEEERVRGQEAGIYCLTFVIIFDVLKQNGFPSSSTTLP